MGRLHPFLTSFQPFSHHRVRTVDDREADQRKAARRRAVIAFVAAGVLVLVSVIGLAWTDDGPGRHGRDRSPAPGWNDAPGRSDAPGWNDAGREGWGGHGDSGRSRSGGGDGHRPGAGDRMPGSGAGWGQSGGAGGVNGQGVDNGRRGDRSGGRDGTLESPDTSDGADASTTTTTPPVGN